MKIIKIVAPFALVCAMAFGDISGTTTLTAGTSFSFDSGTVVTSGADFSWSGSTLTPQGATLAFSVPGGGGASVFAALTQQLLQTYASLGSSTPITSSLLSPGSVFAYKTNGGNYGKALVTAFSGTSLTIQYLTYGATGSGGGGSGSTITSVQNNYGQVAYGLPNYGIAQSSLFYIKGTGLAGLTTGLQDSSKGLPTTLNGVTVSVTVGGTTLPCPLYYLSPTQIDAVLPGKIPVGTGTIIVSNTDGTKSAPAPIVVVQSAFGVINYNGTLAATYDANNLLITSTNAANPNQAIVIWGSGVGYDPNNDDVLYPQHQDNLNIPMQVYVGGVPSTIAYRGRSQFPGVDQIVITIPASVPTGCYVSLAVVTGTIVSNGTTIPIAASGKTCSEPDSLFSPDIIQTLSGKTTIRTGALIMTQSTDLAAGTNSISNTIGGIFESVTGVAYAAQTGLNTVSVGSCLVQNTDYAKYITSSVTYTSLDAGPMINVSGPQGSLGLTPLSVPGSSLRFYTASSVPKNYIPAAGGPFTFDNVSGGADVGHFNTTLNFPANFSWTNSGNVTAIDRTQGATVTWSGGAPGVTVTISGSSSALVNGQAVAGSFTCTAPLSAGQFTIPVPVLLALPAGSGSLSLTDTAPFQTFTASGLDLGYSLTQADISQNVRYN